MDELLHNNTDTSATRQSNLEEDDTLNDNAVSFMIVFTRDNVHDSERVIAQRQTIDSLGKPV